jgi:predicted PurR-regulated permease PerM
MTQRSIGGTVLAIVCSAVAIAFLYALRHAWLMLYVAIVLATMFDPAVKLVESLHIGRWHPHRGLSVVIVVLLVLVIVVVILFVIVPPIAADAERLRSHWPEESGRAIDWIHRHLPFSDSLTADSLLGWFRRRTGGAPVEAFGASLIDVLTTLLVGIYFLVDGRQALNWGLSMVPGRHRTTARAALVNGGHRMQQWVAGQGMLMLTHGGSAFVTFWLLGLPYFVAVAVFAALINVIPFLGPILTLVVAGLIAATEAPGKLLGVVIFYLAYHNVEGAFLQPRIMSRAVNVPGVAIIVALLLGYELAGIVGMVFSVPTAVLL